MRTNKYTHRRKGIVTPYGQWKYPGKVTTIPSNDITMQGVTYPVLGISDAGDVKMMLPGMDYLFIGNEVTEYPMMQTGGYDYSTFFSNADKNKRGYDKNAMLQLDKYWTDKGLNENQRKALMYNVLIESQGGKYLDAHGNGFYGLLGWEKSRYDQIKDKSLLGQAEYIYDTLKNGDGSSSWNHGGKGSGYNSWSDARNAFWNADSNYNDINHALIYGYIRPFDKIGRLNNGNNYYQTGGIHINPKNKGKFTAAAKRAGKSVQAYAAQILANKENYSPTLIKRANFARNASKFKHQEGGNRPSFEEYYQSLPAYKNDTTNYDLRTAYQYLPYEEMKQFSTIPDKHLSSVVELPDGSYRFLKSKNHPSLQQEIDWYNSDEAKEFRNNYTLDTSGEYYRYVPKKHQIGKYLEGNYVQPQTVGNVMNSWNDMLAKGLSKGDNIPTDINKQKLPISKDPSLPGFKLATGGNTAQLANVEHKEIIDDGTKAVVDGKYHENFTDNAEKNGTTINLSGSVSDLLKNNPHLKSMSEATKGRLSNRTNKYTSARRKGIPFVQLGGIMKPVPFYNEYTLASGTDGQEKKWIWPSTVTIGGEITEPRKGADYPLARYINDNILT